MFKLLKNLFRNDDTNDEITIEEFKKQTKALRQRLPDKYNSFTCYWDIETGSGDFIGCEACVFELLVARAVTGQIIHDDGRPLAIIPIKHETIVLSKDDKEIRH